MLMPTLTDSLLLNPGGETIAHETHRVSATAPYHVILDSIPKVRATATTPDDNGWTTVEAAAALLTVEYEVNGVWTALSLTASSTPASGAVFPLIAQAETPYAPVLLFHAAQAGATVRVSYTGLGAAPMAAYAMRLWRIVQSLNAAGFPRLFDLATYNGGWFDGNGVNGKGVYIAPSSGLATPTTDGFATFAGGSVDLATVSAFSTANDWRRVSFSAAPSTSGWTITKTQSTDAATPEALPAPECPFGETLLGWADVQNDGVTGQTGRILPIAAARITTATYRAVEQSWGCPFSIYGTLLTDSDGLLLLPPIVTGQTAQATQFVVMLSEQTSGSTTLTLTKCSTDGVTPPEDVATIEFFVLTAPMRKTVTLLETVTDETYFRVKVTTSGSAAHVTGWVHGLSRA